MRFNYNDGGRSKYFKADKVGDCVTRAIAIANNMDYKEIYQMVKVANGKTPRNGVSKTATRIVMKQLGWTWIPTMTIGSGCQVHLKEDELPKGTIIVQLSHHVSCIIDGVINDTYDCSRDGTRCVYGYFIKE